MPPPRGNSLRRLATSASARFIRELRFEMGRHALARVKAACPSDTLKEALRLYTTRSGRLVVGVPHYWAGYFNDGHRGFGPIAGQFLVWFRSPLDDDPRLGGNYPVRYSDWRHLTKAEFQFGIDANKAAGGPALAGPYMVAVRSKGPSSGTHFFEKGFTGIIQQRLGALALRKFSRLVQSFVVNERSVAKIPPLRFG